MELRRADFMIQKTSLRIPPEDGMWREILPGLTQGSALFVRDCVQA